MNRRKFLVTGGGGFLGRALALRLLRDGHEVHSLSRKAYSELEAAGVHHHQADLSLPLNDLEAVFAGTECVFHTAAKVEMWGSYREFFEVNVIGTRNLMIHSRRAGVPKFIYTSSPSVIAHGRDLCGVSEDIPYPGHFEALYPMTKAIAEQEVLAANGTDGLKTLSLRPHLIFGPGDTNLVPTITARARQGRLMQVGSGRNIADFTFIDDCVSAHICAMEALGRNPDAAGRSFFISQGEPVLMWQWINEVLERSGLPPVRRKISRRSAMFLAVLSELVVRLLPGEREPLLTRFLVSEMSTSHYFNIEAAKRELGYSPRFSMREAMDITFPSGVSDSPGHSG